MVRFQIQALANNTKRGRCFVSPLDPAISDGQPVMTPRTCLACMVVSTSGCYQLAGNMHVQLDFPSSKREDYRLLTIDHLPSTIYYRVRAQADDTVKGF